jgi:hypothetical protein
VPSSEAAADFATLPVPVAGATSGAIIATSHPVEGKEYGLDGVVMSIDPPASRGATYLGDNGVAQPLFPATSTSGGALFVEVTPGVVELTMGPAGVTCVPWYGGWPSSRPNSVRVPVVAGFESQVGMHCHR